MSFFISLNHLLISFITIPFDIEAHRCNSFVISQTLANYGLAINQVVYIFHRPTDLLSVVRYIATKLVDLPSNARLAIRQPFGNRLGVHIVRLNRSN